jgi:hypothetical protein
MVPIPVIDRAHGIARRRAMAVKPNAPATVVCVDQPLRVDFPGQLNLIAWHVCHTASSTGLCFANPEIPYSMFQMTERHPTPIRRQCRIARLPEVEWRVLVAPGTNWENPCYVSSRRAAKLVKRTHARQGPLENPLRKDCYAGD